jgi:hypothetical protein
MHLTAKAKSIYLGSVSKTVKFANFHNKLECLSLASLYSLV